MYFGKFFFESQTTCTVTEQRTMFCILVIKKSPSRHQNNGYHAQCIDTTSSANMMRTQVIRCYNKLNSRCPR